mmetsp:Transcript_55412/g.81456  ORF Transcript_55412/g.81456 Transcript_55412/m.81456 type:complete len:204 (-) Transcript_55412:330-941(-)
MTTTAMMSLLQAKPKKAKRPRNRRPSARATTAQPLRFSGSRLPRRPSWHQSPRKSPSPKSRMSRTLQTRQRLKAPRSTTTQTLRARVVCRSLSASMPRWVAVARPRSSSLHLCQRPRPQPKRLPRKRSLLLAVTRARTAVMRSLARRRSPPRKKRLLQKRRLLRRRPIATTMMTLLMLSTLLMTRATTRPKSPSSRDAPLLQR